jgi:cyclic-di-GMP phosphodiesterase, flagellum assembly factor TipF
MNNAISFKSLLSGPSILATTGILAGGLFGLLLHYQLVDFAAYAKPLVLSLSASGLLCAFAWVVIASASRQSHQIIALEAALARVRHDVVTLRHQTFEQDRLAYAPASDAQQHVAAELRMLQQLLMQVVERRAAPIVPRTTESPALRLVREAETALAEMPETPILQNNTLEIMRSALEDSRIDLYLQPMVKLPNRRATHYEAFSRVRDEDGKVIFPQEYLRPAESAGLIGTLDNLLLFRCITLIRNLGPRKPGTKIFVNLALGSLRDSEFLGDFAYFMSKNEELATRLVFEIAAPDLMALDGSVFVQLSQLAKSGFGFSIDLGETIDLPDDLWRALNIKYVKLRANCLTTDHNSFTFDRLRAQLRQHKAELIATHIEEERNAIDVLDTGADFGQGYLFGKPRLAREDLTVSRAA